jgi:hypothetical protein
MLEKGKGKNQKLFCQEVSNPVNLPEYLLFWAEL